MSCEAHSLQTDLHTTQPPLHAGVEGLPDIPEAEDLSAQLRAFGRLVAGMTGVLWGPVTLRREARVLGEQLNTSEHFGDVTSPLQRRGLFPR